MDSTSTAERPIYRIDEPVRPLRMAQYFLWDDDAQLFRERNKPRSLDPYSRNFAPYPGQHFQNNRRTRFWDNYSQPGIYQSGTYRTMCVRLCDGYYWPISFSTYRSQFSIDESRCRSSCNSPVRLFYYRNPGADIDYMESLDGMLYRRLVNAYLYRTKFVPDCRCRPEPWSEAEVARHRSYKNREDKTHQAGKDRNQFSYSGQTKPKVAEEADLQRDLGSIGNRWIIPERTWPYNRYKIITVEPELDIEVDSDEAAYQNKRSKYYRGRQRNYRTYRYLKPEPR